MWRSSSVVNAVLLRPLALSRPDGLFERQLVERLQAMPGIDAAGGHATAFDNVTRQPISTPQLSAQ